MGQFVDRTGHRYGRLSVLSRVPTNDKRAHWFCRCDCGTEKTVMGQSLHNGTTVSCGCFHIEQLRKPNLHTTKHGMSDSPTYGIWSGVLKRCYSVNDHAYPNYGGRGITVCDRWRHSFQNFFEDMGERPRDWEIERVDVNGNYEPSNCKWIPAAEQARNRRNVRRFNVNGENLLLTDIARRSGMKYGTVYYRYRHHGEAAILTLAKQHMAQIENTDQLSWEE